MYFLSYEEFLAILGMQGYESKDFEAFGHNLYDFTDYAYEYDEVEQKEIQRRVPLEIIIDILAEKDKHITRLILRNLELAYLPPNIGKLMDLEELDISLTRISILPPEIGQLVNLRALDVHGSRVEQIAPEIGRLQKLETLDLSGNN